MTAIRPFCQILGFNPGALNKNENSILEIDFFVRVCDALVDIFKTQYKTYFQILKLNSEMETAIMEQNLIRCIINDILETEDYSLPGVALYTNTSEDVIFEIASGMNTDPSSSLLRKIVELHRSVRPALYADILNKIVREQLVLK